MWKRRQRGSSNIFHKELIQAVFFQVNVWWDQNMETINKESQ